MTAWEIHNIDIVPAPNKMASDGDSNADMRTFHREKVRMWWLEGNSTFFPQNWAPKQIFYHQLHPQFSCLSMTLFVSPCLSFSPVWGWWGSYTFCLCVWVLVYVAEASHRCCFEEPSTLFYWNRDSLSYFSITVKRPGPLQLMKDRIQLVSCYFSWKVAESIAAGSLVLAPGEVVENLHLIWKLEAGKVGTGNGVDFWNLNSSQIVLLLWNKC